MSITADPTPKFHFPKPRSLMGQMLLAVAVALLLVQGIGAFLVYRAQRDNLESSTINAVAFRLIAGNRGHGPHARALRAERRENADRPSDRAPRFAGVQTPFRSLPLRGFQLEFSNASPMLAHETRDTKIEEKLQRLLTEQNYTASDIVVVHREVRADPMALRETQEWADNRHKSPKEVEERLDDHLLVVGVRQSPDDSWRIARVRTPHTANLLVQPLMIQTLIMYLVLVGAIALILRRITRPLAALTRRVEQFAIEPGSIGQLEPSGPEDMQHLILAHNAMEARIVAMLDEKDVMLGAIGHDLKTPLAALRVRIESVENDTERARMASTIEDIVRTLDDILSLARVGRPSDPRERTELSALVLSVVEEYEDMGSPVEVGETQRMVLELRSTWLRRAMRNLIDNALRYGERARVELTREGQRAVITIDDDGPGIQDDRLEDMMNAFTRGDPSRNSTTGGAGLGLALARAIADQHGGELILKNRIAANGTVAGLIARLEIPIG